MRKILFIEFKKNIIGLIFFKIKRRGNINNNDIYGGCGWIQMLNKIIWEEKKLKMIYIYIYNNMH